ncbi:MAG: hypothetical protein NC453_28290 [Muribaculum sp.]|nr:hypothetical protein [Muribaculum sp.]
MAVLWISTTVFDSSYIFAYIGIAIKATPNTIRHREYKTRNSFQNNCQSYSLAALWYPTFLASNT